MSTHTSNVPPEAPATGAASRRLLAVSLVAVVVFSGVVPAVVGGATVRASGDAVAPVLPDDPEGNASNAEDPGVVHPKVADGLLSGAPPGETSEPAATSVVVETDPDASSAVARTVERYGSVRVRHGTLIEAEVERAAVTAIADLEGVQFVRPPYRLDGRGRATGDVGTAAGNVTSEGVAAIGAATAHTGNYTGDDVTVAVVDTGFDVDDPEIADAVVGTRDFSGRGFGADGGDHGTATAEIVTDTAPDAGIYLLKTQSYTQLVAAAEWVGNRTDVDVVSVSLGLRGGVPLDGSARLDREIAESVRNGTVWMSSAGNQGRNAHWNGTWADPDGDDRLNFAGSDENMSVDAPMSLRLQWSDWNGSDQDYDLRVVDEGGNVVATSETTQDGSQDPVEQVVVSRSGTFYVQVRKEDADGEADFDLFYTSFDEDARMEYVTRARTITVPATGRRTTAVGAVNVSTLDLQPYSSRGPTIDGRRKPAFVAPDDVTTSRIAPFEGTSAAAPHAAGAAAIVLDADPSLSPGAVVERLSNAADPLNYTDLPNNRVGAGMVNVTGAVRPQAPLETRIGPDRIDALDADAVPVRVRFGAVPDGGEVVVRLRDRDGETVTGRAVAATGGRSTVVTVDATPLANGPVTARAKLVGTLGNDNVEGFTAESPTVPKNTSALALELKQGVAPSTVPPNGTTTVTARVRPTGAADRLSLVSSFGPNVSGVAIETFRVEGNGTTLFSQIDGDEATFAARGVGANATVVASFDVRVGADAGRGAVVSVASEATAGPATVSVTTKATVGDGLAAYADEEGIVRTSGLQEAIRDWARGEMTTARLQRVIRAWATEEKVV